MFRIAISALLLVACSTEVPDIHPMQVAEEDSAQSTVVNAGTEKTYITPVYRGNFSSEKIRYSSSSRAISSSLKMSSSLQSSSSDDASSSSMDASSSSMNASSSSVELIAGEIDWIGDCLVDFGLTAGEHAISWNVSGVGCSNVDSENGPANYVLLYCETATEESGGASLTMNGIDYLVGVGASFNLGTSNPPLITGGSLETTQDLICHFE